MFILMLLENSPQDIITVCSYCCNMITHYIFFSLWESFCWIARKHFFSCENGCVSLKHITAASRLSSSIYSKISTCCTRRARVGCLFYLHVFITSACTNIIYTNGIENHFEYVPQPKPFASTCKSRTRTRTHICQWL